VPFPLHWAKCCITITTIAQVLVAFQPSRTIVPHHVSNKIFSALSSSIFTGGFDVDRMDALTQRGELEASLMMEASGGVLGEEKPNPNKKKKKKAKIKNKKMSSSMAARTLDQDGVVKLTGILSSDTASILRQEILERRDVALESIRSSVNKGDQNNNDKEDWRKYFADVLLKGNQDQGQRCDLLLPLANNPTLQTALYELLASPSSLLYNTLVNVLGGDDITLYELSSLISEPGSPRQPVHPDNPHQDIPPLLTCFVALQDITPNMGPTNFIPGSHTAEAHAAFDIDVPSRDNLLRSCHNVVALLQAGDASLFDSRTLHCGGANKGEEGSDKTRALVYISFRNPRATEPIGNVGSIMSDIEPMTIRDLRSKLIAAEKNRRDTLDSGSLDVVDPFDEEQAAERGDALVQLKLGNRYYLGEGGVQSDPEKAAHYFQLASDGGLAHASFNLGVCHYEGRGVPRRDLDRALELFALAAEGGHPGAKEAHAEVMDMLVESGREC